MSLATLLTLVTGCPNDDIAVGGSGASATGGSASGTETDSDSNTGGTVATTEVADGTGASGSTGTSDTSPSSGPDSTATDSAATDSATDTAATDSATIGSTGPGEVCGDDMAEGAEECDGTDLAGEDCVSQGFDAGVIDCNPDCTFDTSGCVIMTCGNDTVEGMETCDGTDLAGEDCISQGFDAGTLGCQGDCTALDTSGCITFMCGNDLIEGAEACDGTDLAGEDCVSQGFDTGVLNCQGDCSAFDTTSCVNFGGDCCTANGTPGCDDPICTADVCMADAFCCDNQWDGNCAGGAFVLCPAICDNCGDGVVNSPVETCDGMDLQGETCSSLGFDVGPLTCQADCSGYDTAGCIDFAGDCCAANGTPGCDDLTCTAAICGANALCCTNQWDAACAAAAQVEPACQGVGGSCPAPVCGDGVVEGLEVCDGGALGGETCTSQGFDSGVLACQGDCSGLDTTGCVSFTGDCCANNGSPGCDDAACTASVCGGDPSCCNVAWDASCAAAAQVDPACQGVGGSCPTCGNDVIEGAEVCDGTDVGGADCMALGFDGGVLGCQPDCSGLDTSTCQDIGYGDCVNNPPAAVCLPTEQCVTDLAMPPTVGVCADVACTSVLDCPLPPPGGTSPVQCSDVTGEGINECFLLCGLPGLNCPPGMVCALGFACAWPAGP